MCREKLWQYDDDDDDDDTCVGISMLRTSYHKTVYLYRCDEVSFVRIWLILTLCIKMTS